MLESLGQINIGSLNLEEPKKSADSPFDFGKCINQKEWAEIMDYAEFLFLPIMRGYQEEGIGLLQDAVTIFPDRVQEILDRDMFHAIWRHLKTAVAADRIDLREMEKIRGGVHLIPFRSKATSFAKSLAAVRTLYPNRLGEFGIDSYWPTLKNVLGKLLKPPIFVLSDDDVELSVMSKIAYPNRQIPEMKIQQGYPDKPLFYRFDFLKQQKHWQEFSQKAAYAKVLYPQRIEEIGLDKDVWENIHNQLEETRRATHFSDTSWKDFVSMAASMKILAAKEVRFTDHGLELVMPENEFSFQTPALPEMRKF